MAFGVPRRRKKVAAELGSTRRPIPPRTENADAQLLLPLLNSAEL